jgi:hypothetical protein
MKRRGRQNAVQGLNLLYYCDCNTNNIKINVLTHFIQFLRDFYFEGKFQTFDNTREYCWVKIIRKIVNL